MASCGLVLLKRHRLVRGQVTKDVVMVGNKGSGQIIVTSHDRFPPNGGDCKGIPLISGKSRLVKYYNLARRIKKGKHKNYPHQMSL